jgi:hypothetical protein
MSDPRKAKVSARNFAALPSEADALALNRLAPYGVTQPKRTWPHPELDEAVISLWPLVQRHNWTFGDLLGVLRDVLPNSDIYPCQNERNLATYCAFTLRLRRFGHGKTARDSRPPGYELALRLCLPQKVEAPAVRRFGIVEEEESERAPVRAVAEVSGPRQLMFDGGFGF